MPKFKPADSCEDIREEYEEQISELTDQISSLKDMNKTLENFREDLHSRLLTATNRIKELEDPLAPKNWWQVMLYKNITGRGILYCIALLAVCFLLYKGNIKLSDLTEAVKAIK